MWQCYLRPQCWVYVTSIYLWQGEEMDSSDEEWANAYAAMDPISQLGWGNRGGGVERPTAMLVRDVFIAADALHADAMSQMGGNTEDLDESSENMEASMDEHMRQSRNTSTNEVDNMERDDEGEFFHVLQVGQFIIGFRRLHVSLGPKPSSTCFRASRCIACEVSVYTLIHMHCYVVVVQAVKHGLRKTLRVARKRMRTTTMTRWTWI